jgi:hypothetical protein
MFVRLHRLKHAKVRRNNLTRGLYRRNELPTYNWANLSDYDFELVCRDVMSAVIGQPVESFARGRDGGIDLRYDSRRMLVIGQAKHYLRSTFNDLTAAVEAEKLKLDGMRRKPTRYLLFTTLPLTPNRKDQLFLLLKPYCKRVGDIYGIEDIEGILAVHPDIEEHHYKLWLASIRVLERIMGNATLTRSQMRIDEITERSKLFVPHQKMPDAEQILREEHNLIISGPPGIGKTTMAEMLALRLLAAEYRTYFVTRVEEIEREIEMHDEEMQLFIYDDFLGRTNLREAPDASGQERLFAVMRWVGRKPRKYLILTTREYLYREAAVANERLLESRADIVKCLLDVDGYTRTTRAQILYNHLYWTPGIPLDALRDFVDEHAYWAIIDHPNFNPRWIADTLNRIAPAPGSSDENEGSWT